MLVERRAPKSTPTGKPLIDNSIEDCARPLALSAREAEPCGGAVPVHAQPPRKKRTLDADGEIALHDTYFPSRAGAQDQQLAAASDAKRLAGSKFSALMRPR